MCHGSLHHALGLLTFAIEISLLTVLALPARTDSVALHATHSGFHSSASRNKRHTFKMEQAFISVDVHESVYREKLFRLLFIWFIDVEVKW